MTRSTKKMGPVTTFRERVRGFARLPGSRIQPSPKNFKTHDDRQRRVMRGLLEEIGIAGSALAWVPDDAARAALRALPLGDGPAFERWLASYAGPVRLIDGHLRREEIRQIQPVQVTDLDETEAAKALATFDAVSDLAGTDTKLLASLLADLGEAKESGVTELLGHLQRMIPADSKPSDGARVEASNELLRKWGVKKGQIWACPSTRAPDTRLVCGDSTNPEHVAAAMDGERASLFNTDAPYGIDYAAVKNGIPRSGFQNIVDDGGTIVNDDLIDGPALQAFLEQVIKAALPHLIEAPAFYFWHPMLTQGTFFAAAAAAAAADILIHRQIVWVKPRMVLTRSGQYHWKHELCFYGWRRGYPCAWYGDKSQTSVWNLGLDPARMHPTQKPVALFEQPILNHTTEGDVLYEPFFGSGSQAVCAYQMGRSCRGLEIEPRYVAVALERLSLLGAKPVFVGML